MKWLVYAAVIAASLLVPLERTDVGKLQPIEVVAIYIENNQITLKTELGDMGKGQTITEALNDMKQTTAGIVYLDTAEYLLVGRNAQTYIPDMNAYLKDNVRICAIEGDMDLKEAAGYLDSHRPSMEIDQWSRNCELEILKVEGGRLILMKSNGNEKNT